MAQADDGPWSMQDLDKSGLDRLQWDGVVNDWPHVVEMVETERCRRRE
jgi:hypothetical protein